MADASIANAIQVLNVQGQQIGHIPRIVAAKLAKYMDQRSLLIEAQITGPKGVYDCPIELKFYGTNEPVERENLLTMMRADKLPVGHAADRKRKEAAAEKERKRLAKEAAKQAKKRGGAVVGAEGGQTYDNNMAEFMAGSSQGIGPGPSLEDIIGNSERFNPRNIESVVEEFGIKEKDLVCRCLVHDRVLLTAYRQRCQRRLSPRRLRRNCIPSNCKACSGCWTKNHPSFQLKTRKMLCSSGNVTQGCQTRSRTLQPTIPLSIPCWPQGVF